MDQHTIYTTNTAEETEKLGERMAVEMKDKNQSIVCLFGNLGMGKTTWTKGFAKGLGIIDRIISPTFTIIRRYAIAKTSTYFYHIDLYRMENNKQIEAIGLEEILHDADAITVIEWPEKIRDMLPKKRIELHFTSSEGNSRIIDAQIYE